MSLVANSLLVILSLALGLRLLKRYKDRPRPHTLWYAVGLLLTAVAALPELYLQAAGSLVTPLWWLYWMTASSLVGFLAVGTAYLLAPRVGQVTLGLVYALVLWLVAVTIMTAGPAPVGVTHETLNHAPTVAVKIPFLIQNIAGSMLILIGAAYSYIRTRALYNVWIALGTIVFASGGASAGLLDFPGVFYFTQTAGIILLYLGVSQSVAPRPQPKPAAN
ncbi:MAG TPA: hypothetical protein VK464_04120 [Symbiobacteriaceae bacterium]|nr:hypothetical protein [Symbiobacteriaceae bacterium]